MHMPFILDDGGRAVAGFRGKAGDCVTRSIAIASGLPYREVHNALSDGIASQRERHMFERARARRVKARSAERGVLTQRKWFKDYMRSVGFVWTPTMRIGSGCRVHLVAGELPAGRLVVCVSKHYTAVIDGVVRDTFDPQRTTESASERCVYGYWTFHP